MSRKSDDHAEEDKKKKVRSRKSDGDHADDDAEEGKKRKVRKLDDHPDDHPDDHAEGDKKEKVSSRKSDDHAEGNKKKKVKSGKKGVVAGKSTKDMFTALKLVLKKAWDHKGLSRGLHECTKTIERDGAKLCLIAADCDKSDYVNRIKALCTEHNVGLISIPSSKTIGEWAGLARFDAKGNVTKVMPCTCLVVKDFGEDTEALHIVQEFLGI